MHGDAARRLQSKNNLKQFGLALQNYDDTHMAFPPGGTFDAAGNAHHGWLTFLYPYLYASPWYNFVNFDVPWDDPLNIAVFKLGENFGETLHNPSIRETKSADGFTLAHYAANQRLMHRNSTFRLNDFPNIAGTWILSESAGDYVPCGYPYNWRDALHGLNRQPSGLGCSGRNSTMILIVDGSVRELSNAVDSELLLLLSGPDELKPSSAQTEKPTIPYKLNTTEYWEFNFCLREHRELVTFRTSPDRKKLSIHFNGGPCDGPHCNQWMKTFQLTPHFRTLEEIDVEGAIDVRELWPLLEHPTLKRLDLAKARINGDKETALKHARPNLIVE